MPKLYSIEEREKIVKELKFYGEKAMKENGIKKTTVDYLVEKVGIPKGTFYLFYKSKELLLFDIIQDLHVTIEKQLLAKIITDKREKNVDYFTDLLFDFFEFAKNTCLIRILTDPKEMELLIQKLPDDVVKEHLEHDDDIAMSLLKFIPTGGTVKPKIISGALRGIFLLLPFQREIGSEEFDESIRLLIRGVVLQLFVKEEKNNDSGK